MPCQYADLAPLLRDIRSLENSIGLFSSSNSSVLSSSVGIFRQLIAGVQEASSVDFAMQRNNACVNSNNRLGNPAQQQVR